MGPTNPEGVTDLLNPEVSETSEQSSTQKRINELVAKQHEAEARAKAAEAQSAALMERLLNTPVVSAPVQAHEFKVPEGVDPATAAWFKQQLDEQAKAITAQTAGLYNQVASQLDSRTIDQEYGALQPSIRAEAKRIYSILKQKYPDANMADAVKAALGEAALQGLNKNARATFNAAGQPIAAQTAMSNFSAPTVASTSLTPPTQIDGWDSFPVWKQNALLDEYEKKGGKLIG